SRMQPTSSFAARAFIVLREPDAIVIGAAYTSNATRDVDCHAPPARRRGDRSRRRASRVNAPPGDDRYSLRRARHWQDDARARRIARARMAGTREEPDLHAG